MVSMDGIILNHAYERVNMPAQELVDAYLPTFEPRLVLDPANPYSIGAMVCPEALTEVRHLAHGKRRHALTVIPEIKAEFEEIFGHSSGGLIRSYNTHSAGTTVVAHGSVAGMVKDVVDEMRDDGQNTGVVTIGSFRHVPTAQAGTRRVVVLVGNCAVGFGCVVANNTHMALHNASTTVNSVVAGRGRRPITMPSLRRLIERANRSQLEPVEFLDLQWHVVNAELARQRAEIASGPTAESILKNIEVDTTYGGAPSHAAE